MGKVVARTAGLGREYRRGPSAEAPTTRALDGVDLEIHAGEFVAVMGPSGSGKTTLLNLLGALDTPTSGIVEIDGDDITHLDDRARTALRRERLGFVFQQFNLIPHLTAHENVEVPLLVARHRDRAARAAAALEKVSMGHRAGALPATLSGGEQQRVAIARALLADEPTGNLDSETGAGVIDLLDRVRREGGHAVVMVTHDDAMARRADRVIRLRDGRIDPVR